MLDVYVDYDQNRATLRFSTDQATTCFFECTHEDHRAPVVYDFAAYACITIAHRYKTSVKLHAPITQVALENCQALSEFSRTAWGRSAPFAVLSDDIVPARAATGDFKSHCISTGIDSTYALIRGVDDLTFTHGLVVHGADYRLDHISGFDALEARVHNICRKSGLKPITVKTNLRSIGYNWSMHHIAQLAACMHFLGPNFSDLAFAADNTIAQDMKRFPWGNNYFIGTHLSSGNAKVHYIGYEVDRYEKIKAIQRDARYIQDLGVCFMDKKDGWNCGACPKCVMTRVAFECEGASCPPVFKEYPEMATFFDTLEVASNRTIARGIAVRSNEIIPHVNNTDLKRALIRYRNQAIRRMK